MLDRRRSTSTRSSDGVVRGRYVNQRVAVVPMEPDCCAAAPAEDGRITVWPSHADAAPRCTVSSRAALGWDVDDIHVVTPQVGGGFGGKAGLHARVHGGREGRTRARPPGRVGAVAHART